MKGEASQTIIALVGRTGVGKSTLAPRIAEKLSLPWFDVDMEIGKLRTTPLLGSGDEWSRTWRFIRKIVIERLIDSGPCVIATGCEDFSPEIMLDELRERTLSVWLEAETVGRLGETHVRLGKTTRYPTPLKDSFPVWGNRTEFAHTKFFTMLTKHERESIYRCADISVNLATADVDDAEALVMSALERHFASAAKPVVH